jgi:hypothetical protein
MRTSGPSDHEPRQPDQLGEPPTTSTHSEEVLAWELIGDDLWLPRRVRGSFHGGALG